MNKSQLKILFFMLILAAAVPLFAADIVPSGLNDMGNSIMEVFTGGLVRTILICCLAGCGVAYGFNKDNEKMKRNVIAIAIGIAIVVGAQVIVKAIWDAAGH
jgi:type IV secretory pathway VirB2 component (pilin)